MDFFEHQAHAKAASRRLLLLFVLICFVFISLVNSVFYLFIHLFQATPSGVTEPSWLMGFLSWQFSVDGLIASSISIFIIGIGCLSRWLELRKGGNGLAIKVGARSLGFASNVEKEQQLINVVEEMAIASGVTSPGVYVLDHEKSINAFVAGYSFQDSALVVTKGLLDRMSRDELQAVVGHEFSHILHGDNRINIRLLVLLAGFVWVVELGRMMMVDSYSRHKYGAKHWGFNSWNTRSNKDSGAVFFIGIPLMIAGYIGLFFGMILRTAISRKREYLADASAVQFTRNPEALASALNVIKENAQHGFLKMARAEEVSHMCISPTKRYTWFATHPPIESRINVIDSTFFTRFKSRMRKKDNQKEKEQKQNQMKQVASSIYQADVSRLQNEGNQHLHNVIGTLTLTNLDYAISLHDQMPFEFRQSLQDPEKARIMLLYLLLDDNEVVRQQQQAWLLEQYPDAAMYLKTLTLLASSLQARFAIPLVELLVPLLKTLDAQVQQGLLEQVLVLAKWDKKLNLFEICLYSLLKQSFSEVLPNRSSHAIKNINVVSYEFNYIISCLVHNTGSAENERHALHQRMLNVFTMKQGALIEEKEISAKKLYLTLKKLASLSPMLKRSLMDVCGDIVLHDGIVRAQEYEALKLISLTLSCPMPALPLTTST